jgi:hypothetical protein
MKPNGRKRIDAELTRKLARLRELLLLEAELSAIWDYFQDVLASDAAFIDAGVRIDGPGLPDGFEDALKELEPKGRLNSSFLTRLEGYSMLHGCARWGRGYAFFFLFEEIEQGFCAYSGGLTSKVIEFAQFTVAAHPRAQGHETSVNAPS